MEGDKQTRTKLHLAVTNGSEGSVHRWMRGVLRHIHVPNLVPAVIHSRPSPPRTTTYPLYVIVTSAGGFNRIVIIEVAGAAACALGGDAVTLYAMGAALIAEALLELFDDFDDDSQAMRGDFFPDACLTPAFVLSIMAGEDTFCAVSSGGLAKSVRSATTASAACVEKAVLRVWLKLLLHLRNFSAATR